MNDSFGLAAFRSRTQVLRMEDALHRAGLSAGVIATPREVAIGCGLSVRFDLAQTPQVMQVYRRLSPGALIGFYRVEGYGTRRLTLTPLVEKPIYKQPGALTRGCLWGYNVGRRGAVWNRFSRSCFRAKSRRSGCKLTGGTLFIYGSLRILSKFSTSKDNRHGQRRTKPPDSCRAGAAVPRRAARAALRQSV